MKTILLTLALVAILGTCVRAQYSAKKHGFAVQTTVAEGTLEGIYSTTTNVQHYLGIPFAAPPTGNRRWQAPATPASWDGVREAKIFGPRAVQPYIFDDMRFRSDGMSEDCLYLNVWTPVKKGQKNLAVLLYFHGGGNFTGSGDELRYDGETLAREGIIVVTANYRLGVFGFLSHPELSEETEHASGNYGLMDQVAAINWVKANIAAFGGNPNKITIGGESAGSIDCSMLMASPLSRDNIAGVLGQSGAAMLGGMEPMTAAVAEENGKNYLKTTGYKNIAELRKAPTRDLYEAQLNSADRVSFSPVVDGLFLEETPLATYEAGRQAQVPLMVGWTSTETAWMPAPKSADIYRKQLEQRFGDRTNDALKHYPADDLASSAMALASDSWIVLGTWKWSNLHAQTGNAPVYRYQFDRVRPALIGETRDQEPPGAGHATDIEYFFNSLKLSDAYDWKEADRMTTLNMSQYLVNFVKNGNPHGDYLTPWPAVEDVNNPPVMHLNEKTELKHDAPEARHRFLESVTKGGK
jgi:para-nitrobenzyl esterase